MKTRAYAQELMDAYSAELQLKAHELAIEAEMSLEYAEANQVLEQFRLK
jgi:hypothetical protein